MPRYQSESDFQKASASKKPEVSKTTPEQNSMSAMLKLTKQIADAATASQKTLELILQRLER